MVATRQRWNWVTFCDPATQWPGNPATRRPSRPGDPVLYWTLNVDLCVKKYSQAKEFLIIIGKSKSSVISVQQQTHDNVFCHFSISNVRFAFWAFFRKPEKLGSHTGSKWWPGDPLTQTWKMTQMTHWPGDPMTQFHVCYAQQSARATTFLLAKYSPILLISSLTTQK